LDIACLSTIFSAGSRSI